jgi:hypothetical protein
MKRAFLEWGTIASTALSFLIAACWAISSLGYEFDSRLKIGRAYFLVEGGALKAFSDPDNDEMWSILDRWGRRAFRPPVVGDFAWSIPGLTMRGCRWSGGRIDWSLRMSLLILQAATALVAGVCGIRYRRVSRAAIAHAMSQSGT